MFSSYLTKFVVSQEMATTLLLTAMLALACLSSGTAAYYEAPPDADAAQALSVADLGPLQTLTDQQLSAVVAQEEVRITKISFGLDESL